MASPTSSPTWWIWTWSSNVSGRASGFLVFVLAGRNGWGAAGGQKQSNVKGSQDLEEHILLDSVLKL